MAFSDSEIIARTITGCVLFACLGDDDLESLKNAAKRRAYKEGEVLIEEGDKGDDLFIIDAGDVEVSTRLTGGEVKLATLGPGAVLGEVALMTGVPRTSTVSALNQVDAITLPGDIVQRLSDLYPELKKQLLRMIQDRANHTLSRIPTAPS
jgi:CRP-like cAMP-binding protein